MEEKFKDIISKIESMTIVELAELVKILEEKFGISAATAVSAGAEAASGDESAVVEKTSFDVILKTVGDQKINVIKMVKEIAGLGLIEAKTLVETAPKTIKTGLKKEDAEELKKKLETVGATVELT